MFSIDHPVTVRQQNGVTAIFAEGEKTLTFRLRSNRPFLRYMAMERHSESWCRPFFGTDPRDIPANTALLLLQTEEGRF